MLFDNVETKRAIEAIRAGAVKWTKDELTAVLRLARARKDPAFDEASREAQARYSGRQHGVLTAALREEYPNTDDMPVAPINWMKMFARLDAGVYVVPADRWLDDEDGARIADDEPAGELWQWALKRARFQAQMAEAERRMLVTPGVVVGQVVWLKPPGDPIGFPRIDLYWPHDVEVLCHWQAPTTFAFAYVVALRQAPPDASAKGEWYRVWSRTPPDTVDGEWGPWTSVLASTAGEQAAETAAPEAYAGKLLPVFLGQLVEPDGYVFSLQDTDLVAVVDDLNKRRSNESFVIRMQGHDQAWTNDVDETTTRKGGPDAMMRISPTATMGLLSPNPKLSDMRESRELALREIATARGNSPHAYVTKAAGPPQSGVAMRIENLTHDVRVAEQALLMQSFEEDGGPLAILRDVVETFHPDGAVLGGTKARMMPRKLPTIEEPSQRQQRLEAAVNAGWITKARAAADAELYGSLDEARKALDEIGDVPDAPKATVPPPTPADDHGAAPPVGAGDTPVPEATDAVQDTALNGAQGATLMAFLVAVGDGTLEAEAAIIAIKLCFPSFNEERVRAMVGAIEVKPKPEPPPSPFGGPPSPSPPAPPEGDSAGEGADTEE